jgi:7-carboxy-7-deazaguanine synthase
VLSVSEIFESLQGEGPNRGQPVVFLRTAGCNLRCTWCDTPYALELRQGTRMSSEEVLEKIKSFSAKHIVLTGGEPMIQQQFLKPIFEQLPEHYVEVETNGGFASDIDEHINQYNCSPKLTGSGNKSYELKLLPNEKTWYKFVIDTDEDLNETLDFIHDYKLPSDRIQLMAQGRTKVEQEEKMDWVEELSKEHGFFFTPRLHILDNYR